MCTVSNIYDFGRHIPEQHWDHNLWMQFQLLLQRMNEIDNQLKLKDCADPAKAEWMAKIEARLVSIEAQNKPKSKSKKKSKKKDK